MPRLEGRESTARKIRIEDGLLVSSFISVWDPFLPSKGKRPCVIDGCDHKIGDDCGGAATCAFVVRESAMDETIGLACSHCVNLILDHAGLRGRPPF